MFHLETQNREWALCSRGFSPHQKLQVFIQARYILLRALELSQSCLKSPSCQYLDSISSLTENPATNASKIQPLNCVTNSFLQLTSVFVHTHIFSAKSFRREKLRSPLTDNHFHKSRQLPLQESPWEANKWHCKLTTTIPVTGTYHPSCLWIFYANAINCEMQIKMW